MPSASSGRIVKSSKGRTGTAHHKNHRWESFTAKIAKLNSLDPLRRVRRHDLIAEDLEKTTSYFKNGLDRWQELNISGVFVEFLHQVLPFSDSLPQILHFEDKIMDLLVSHLEKKDREAFEPLLQLLTEFAHDLGSRFEKHFERAMALVISIVGISQDADIVEWSFTCLAFMFKYLSKLLVSDLRPTYDLLAPLLGKDRQQPHTARFAAEALSFLIKKAGAADVREKALNTIVIHAKCDLLAVFGTRQYGLYYHGVMTMFAESIKGNGFSVHSSGVAIIKSMFEQFDGCDITGENKQPWSDVIFGVLTSLVHHTTAESFSTVLEAVLDESTKSQVNFQNDQTIANFQMLMLSSKAIGIIVGVRKGSRVENWPVLLKCLFGVLEVFSKHANIISSFNDDRQLWSSLVLTTAMALQYSPMDAAIPFISGYLGALAKDPLANLFLSFCDYFSQVDSNRFRSIVFPYFQRFVLAHWSDSDNVDTLCVLVPKLVSSGAMLSSVGGKDGFNLPQSWQDQIVSKFERLEVSPFPEQAPQASYDKGHKVWHDQCLPKYGALLEILENGSVHPSTEARIVEIILRKLRLALRPSSTLAADEAHFIVGQGFSAYVRMTQGIGKPDESLRPLLRAAAPRYSRLPNFLQAMLSYETSLANLRLSNPSRNYVASPNSNWTIGHDNGDGDGDLLISSLVENLCSESHNLRLLSLRLLVQLFATYHGQSSEALATMLLIEQTPLDLQSARSASMYIRKLATMYKSHISDTVLGKAVSYFCFGMLTVKFAQMWDDAVGALSQIAETATGQDIIAELAFKWLEVPSPPWSGFSKVEQPKHMGLTDFECSNFMQLDTLARSVRSELKSAQNLLLTKFESDQQLVAIHPSSSRTKALQVLSGIPYIAERRSRQLVPMFLSWAGEKTTLQSDIPPSVSNWTRRDQKSLLDLFALFANPRVLYKSTEVHASLLALLANGDVDIQKSALKAVLTWKSTSIKPYEENLFNLLDEARFKDEVTILLQGQTPIEPEHRTELLPVLLRLLYGRIIARKGAASGKQGMENRRLTVLRSLSQEENAILIGIALGELKGLDVKDITEDTVFNREIISARKQVGFVNMMEDVIKELGTNVAPFTSELLCAILYCLVFASRRLQKSFGGEENDEQVVSQTSMLKAIRQNGLKCMVLLFANDVYFDWNPFLPVILNDLISPRLAKLPIETAQSVSGLLQIFWTWSSSPKTVSLLGLDTQILPKIAQCISLQKSKHEVKLFALNIIRNVIHTAQDDSDNSEMITNQVNQDLLRSNLDAILVEISNILQAPQDLSKTLLELCVGVLSELAPFISGSTPAKNFVNISIFLLDQPSRRVNPKIKSNLLLVLEHLVPLYNLQNDHNLSSQFYNTITSLFGFFRDRPSREILSRVLEVFSRNESSMAEVASICADLNSFADGRLDEPDYDRRLRGFTLARKERLEGFTAYQWKPLVYNMLFFIRHDEEFGILSSNSSDSICYFLTCARQSSDPAESALFQEMLSSIVLPALYSGVREPSEVIRREYVKVMAHLVGTFCEWTDVSDMQILLRSDDELESSFFNNILAVGKGRQSSALGLLAKHAERGEISSRNISHFFIPLIEPFIFDRADGNDAHNLAAEATSTVGILAGSLEWSQYKAVLRRYNGYIKAKPGLEKQIIRLLDKIVDALVTAVKATIDSDWKYEDDHIQHMALDERNRIPLLSLATSIPKQAKLTEDLKSNIIPPLLEYLHDKDESTVSLRVPVAIILIRLLKIMAEQDLKEMLPAILTDICHILRSKSQEARDMTRDTLTKLCVLLGPQYFGFVLKELRGALPRGYQLHVLSYTMHSILVASIPYCSAGDLDLFLPSIIRIIMDDIFGITGQEKDAEEYVSKMKEVKSSKSHDSMELIARTVTLSCLTQLVGPIQVLLKEKLNTKIVRKVDELLNRITNGLLRNPDANSRDVLQFCYDIIQDVYKYNEPGSKVKEDFRVKKYLIQRGASRGSDRGSTTAHTYKLVRFAFDVMSSVLKKHDNLRISANIAQFVPIIGDALVQSNEEVKVAAFRLLIVLVKVPVKVDSGGTNLYKVAAVEATRCLASSSSMTSDIAQAGLKLISVILRDRHDIQIKTTWVDELVGRLKDDITDPDRRYGSFNFTRSVLDAKVESAGVYDFLDYIGTVMVTNDDKVTRDLARATYFQFLRDYPQKKNRWSKQLAFIVANLKYEREGGRLSILEVIHLLLSKSANDFVQEVAATCFVPLILLLVNDDIEECRMAAGELIKKIFQKADKNRLQTFLGLLRSWINQEDNPSVLRLAFLSYGLYYEVHFKDDTGDLENIEASILEVLKTAETSEADWELLYASLQLTATLGIAFPSRILRRDKDEVWKSIRICLSYPHAWVKLSAAKLMSTYFADFAGANFDKGFQKLPLKGTEGLELAAEDLRELLRRTTAMFKTPGFTEPLSTEVTKSLVFLGRCAGYSGLSWTKTVQSNGEVLDEEDDVDAISSGEVISHTALTYLFGRLSFILRRESSPPRAQVLVPKKAALRIMQDLCSNLPKEVIATSLQSILLPLNNLTDSSIPVPYSTDDLFKKGYEDLKNDSQQVMDVLQSQCGTAVYTAELQKMREGVKARRNQRSSKRKIEAVATPDKFGRDKKKRVERKKERRKEKGLEHRDRRSGW